MGMRGLFGMRRLAALKAICAKSRACAFPSGNLLCGNLPAARRVGERQP